MATYAIGDVQGCFKTLCALLDTINFDRKRDQLWFAGDLINRGPQSLDVLRFVKSLGHQALSVLGNHELHLLAITHGLRKPKPKDTLTEILEAPDRKKLLNWLHHLPLYHYNADLKFAMVHAGLPPQWTLDTVQKAASEVETLLRGPSASKFLKHYFSTDAGATPKTKDKWERMAYSTNCLTRLRFCDKKGHLHFAYKGPPGAQPEPYLPWFDCPSRLTADQSIVFGHWAALGPCSTPNVYPLDTGCVWGGPLTAMCLETKTQYTMASCEPRSKT